MVEEASVKEYIREYYRRKRKVSFLYDNFAEFVIAKEKKNQNEVSPVELKQIVADMEKSFNIFKLKHEENILKIIYLNAEVENLTLIYKKIITSPNNLFPGAQEIQNTDAIKGYTVSDLIEKMEDTADNFDERDVVEIFTHNDFRKIYIPALLLNKYLIQICILKLKEFLSTEKNYVYMRNKLNISFSNNELSIINFLDGLKKDPGLVLRGIKKPSQSFLQIIIKFASIIHNEYLSNSNNETKTAMILGDIAISCVIIKSFVTYYRSLTQKKNNMDLFLKEVLNNMQNEPYIFTFEDITSFNINGKKLYTKIKDTEMNSIIQEKSRTSGSEYKDIITVQYKDIEGITKTYYILKLVVCFYLTNEKKRIKNDLEKFYTDSWVSALYQKREFVTMRNKQKFQEHVQYKMVKDYTLVSSILTLDIVSSLSKDNAIDKIHRKWLASLISSSEVDFVKYLELNQKAILDNAKRRTPSSNPIVKFFKSLFSRSNIDINIDHDNQEEILSKKKKKEVKDKDDKKKDFKGKDEQTKKHKEKDLDLTDTSANHPEVSQKTKTAKLDELSKKYNFKEEDNIDKELNELSKKWLPVIGKSATNLIADINALCDDTLRKMQKNRRGFVPEADSIKSQIELIIESDNFKDVKDAKAFEKYLALYFYKILK